MKMSSMRAMLQEGCIAQFYTLKGWFVKIKPAFQIDKVLFAFVKKGTNGKTYTNVYVNTDNFDSLCDDILSGALAKKIASDSSSNPGTWKYVTGKDGCKSVCITKGSSQPIIIKGHGPEISSDAFIGINSMTPLIDMAKWWKRVSKPYYTELVEVLCNAENQQQEYHLDASDEDASDENCTAEVTEDVKNTSKPSTAAETSKPIVSEGSKSVYTLVPTNGLEKAYNYTDEKPSFVLRCNCKQSNTEVEVIFLSAYIKNDLEKFNQFSDVLSRGARPSFTIEGTVQNYRGKEQLRFFKFVSSKGAR